MDKHICFIIPTISAGGAERVVSILANHLASKKYTVSIVCLVNDVVYPIDKRVHLIFPDFKILRKLSTLLNVIRYYRKIIRSIQPDIIISFLEFYNEILMLSLLGINKYVYLCDRNNPLLKIGSFAQLFLRKKLYPRANGIIVQTRRAEEFIKENSLSKNILVLPNPISDIYVEWNPGRNKIITCIGRLEPQKNHKYLLDVFSGVENGEWVLQFVGDGSLRGELVEYVKKLKLESKVRFLGLRSDIQEILAGSTIFAFPSLWEGFPNSLLEAMAVGVPCISNNCETGPSELIVDGDNGFLIDVGDVESFRGKLTQLMLDENLRKRFSDNGKKVRELYNVEGISRKLLGFIKRDLKD